MPRTLAVSVVQMLAVDGEKDRTVDRMMRHLDEAGRRGSELTVLPEVWTGLGFSDPNMHREIAEEIPGPVTDRLCEKAREHGMAICGSLYERDGNAVHNTAPVISQQGEIVGRYRKTHIALLSSPESGQEKFYFRPGNALPVFRTSLGTIGILICYDRGFPEAWRVLVLQGAEIVLVPITTTDEDGFAEMARTRCFENGVFGVFVNRCGIERDKRFFGGSLVAGPRGELLAHAGPDDALLVATLDLATIEPTRLRLPYLRDRRPELYTFLTGGS